MPRPRRRQPDPARFPPCVRCGQCYPGGAGNWPGGRVCRYCYLQARLRAGTCAGCGALTSLPGLNAAGQAIFTRCSGIPARFRCGCMREVTAGERGRCWWCVRGGSCGQLASTFLSQLEEPYPLLYLLGVVVILLVPAVIGIF